MSSSVNGSRANSQTRAQNPHAVPAPADEPTLLRRQSSSGSMTERTFRRSPSPGGARHQRSQSTGGTPRHTTYPGDMDNPPPPVPAIPESVNVAAARARGGPRPKSLSLVSTPVKTASQRMAEQQAKHDTGGSWFGAATVGDLGSVRASDAIMAPAMRASQHPQAPAATTGTQGGGAGERVGDLGSVKTRDSVLSTPPPPLLPRMSQENPERPESCESSVNFSYPARVRVASPKGASPTRLAEGERGQAGTQSPVPQPQPKPKRRSSTISPQRGGSVRSSRPSSIASSQDQTLEYDPNSRRMVPRAELLAVEQQVQAAAERRQKTKKSSSSSLDRAGSHLAKGTMGRSHGTAVDNGVVNEAAMAAAASLRSHRVEEQHRAVEGSRPELEEEDVRPAVEHVLGPQGQDSASRRESQTRRADAPTSPASNAPEVFPPPDSDAVLHRRPSVVREEGELDSDAELEVTPSVTAALDAVPVRKSVYAHGVPSPPQSEVTDDQPLETAEPAPAEIVVAPAMSLEPKSVTQAKQVVAEAPEMLAVRQDSRAHSSSPARNARFGTVQEAPVKKHEPPARSLSPRKSAMKQSSPSRGASPARDHSEVSDTPTQEPFVQRRKSVRVSFDDGGNVVLGETAGRNEAESPVPPSPQQATGRKPWYSTLGIGRKKDAVPLEEDEVMKPRPALPSFGSVRGRKTSPRPAEERPLVRPYEAPGLDQSSPEVERWEAMGQSNDHAVGAIFHEQGPRNGANISKVREPLPPVVTSIEGSGYASDSASSENDAALLADTPKVLSPKLSVEESHVSQASTLVPEQQQLPQPGPPDGAAAGERATVDVKDFGTAPVAKANAVPAIAITQPSPQFEQKEPAHTAYGRFPGEFPETETETENEVVAHTPARQETFEPVAQSDMATAVLHTPDIVPAAHPEPASEPTNDSDESSVYSDAYEDLSDLDGDGFQSLDAVVDSPLVTTPPTNVLERAEAQRAETVTPTPQARGEMGLATTEPVDHWAAAKAYWRSLTAEKRAQLEREAADEAGTEGDLEEVVSEAKKPRRKKSVEKRNAEKRAIEEHRAAAVADPDRTYMIKPGTKAGHLDSESNNTATTARGQQQPQQQQQQSPTAQAESGTRLRKTMRGAAGPAQPVETGTHMRKSLRGPEATPEKPARTASPTTRRLSSQSLGNSSTARHSRALSEITASTTNQGILKPSLRRRGSDSSESSFRRARPASSASGGFRKTMRAGGAARSGSVVTEGGRQQEPSSRFSSVRGMSPPVSSGRSMRSTLRGDHGSPARRGSEDSANGKGYLRFSGTFGRPSAEKQNKKGNRGKQSASRFGGDDDSSDEDGGVVSRRFSSRFEDSSDEDLVVPPAEARGSLPLTAKTMRGGVNTRPSPPLPEEEELSGGEDATAAVVANSEKAPAAAGADPGVKRSRSGSGMERPRPSSHGRRGSFISSVLRRRNKKDGGDRGDKISRPGAKESAARRDTGLERSADEIAALRGAARPGERVISWPLGGGGGDDETDGKGGRTGDLMAGREENLDVIAEVEGDGEGVARPRSPGSTLGHSRSQPSLVGRPAFMSRRTLSTSAGMTAGAADDLGSVVDGGGGGRKKKKFGALRKMFRLDD